ncbi:MAG: lipoyl(octanoyl) transferase LipB [Ghiorsea sp.]
MINTIRQSETQSLPAYQWLGCQAYPSFLEKMELYAAHFNENPTVWFCEHEHVYTTGKRGINNSRTDLSAPLIQTERGGETTYHGLGQLMMYPIINLKDYHLSVRDYVSLLEESVIQLLQTYEVYCQRDCGLPGVWLNKKKIAALGIRVSKGITSHGIALNVNTDLKWFDKINPCGISRKATSMQQLGIQSLSLEQVSQMWFDIFTQLLSDKQRL